MEFLSIAVDKLWNYTVLPIAKQVGYLISYRNNLNELTEEVAELKLARESVQHQVDAALRNGKGIESNVQKWLEKVDEISGEYEKLNNDERHAKAGCSIRSFPNFYYRHKLSRQSKKMKEAMVETKLRGKFDRVSFEVVPKFAAPISTISSTPEDPNVQRQLESRVLIQNDVTNALKDPMVHKIGVYGLGGVGKTTLAKAIAEKAQQDKLFDVVAFANVTQSPNLEKIQQEIADMLGLKYTNESLIGRACQLRDRLNMKSERILIILDDLWGELKMDDVGIPNVHNGLKIIMTSRNKEILSNQMNIREIFLLGVLPKIEAWNLFKEKSQFDENVVSGEFLSIATDVAEECGGLPIAIVTVASALRNRDLLEWKDVLRQLQNPALIDITSTQDRIYKPIKVSYDKLENDLLKKIFLLCGVMQQNSLVMDLFKNSVGLGLFRDIYILEDARNSLYTCIRKLKDLCLLFDGDSHEHFSMHDVVKDGAIFLACSEQHLFIKRNEREEWPEGDQLINCRTIILDDRNIDEILEGLYCPSLIFFYMKNKTDYLKIADNFFEGMRELRVLKLAGKKLDSLPSSIHLLSKLRTLCLNIDVLGNWGIIGELKSLRVLTLRSAKMRQLPLELCQLTRLQLLDLRGCNNLELIPSNLLSRLTKLEELYLPTDAYLSKTIQWSVLDPRNQQGKASLAELNDLVRLTTLEVLILDLKMAPKDVVFERFKSYKIIIGSGLEKYFYWSFVYDASRVLQLIDLNTSISPWHNLKSLLYIVECLCLFNLKGAENIIPRTINEEGILSSSHEIQTIVDSWGWDPAVDIFPNLESLVINDCRDLEEICNGSLTGRSFSRLKAIDVYDCVKMKTLFSISSNENAMSMLQFVELQSLSLKFLPELISFWHEDKRDSSDHGKQLLSIGRDGEIVIGENVANPPIALFNDKVMLPNLEKIIIGWVHKLNTIWHWEQQLCPNSFDKLRKLEITDCSKLVIIFPYHIGNSLHSLETLSIESCESLEHVFDVQGVYVKETCSEISGLPIGVLCFPNLQEVCVGRCERLKYLFPTSVAKTLEKLQSLKVEECSMIEEIIIKEETINPSFSEENEDRDYDITFSKLKFLKLKRLSRLRSFSSINFISEFSLLENFIVIECPKLETFSKGMPITPSLQSVQIEDKGNESYWEGNLNATIQKIYIDKVGFSSIRLSELTSFPQLKKLWEGHVSMEFKYLTSLEVDDCEFDSNVIIPFNVLKSLSNLEEIRVSCCESVEAVFDLEGINNQERNVTLETKLKKLLLGSLPNLKHIWNGDGKEIVSFQNLQIVTAFLCGQLTSVFPANIAKGLTQLEGLSVWYCGVEEIVAKEEGQAMSLSFMFPKLTKLTIQDVPNLKCFYPRDCIVECPKLKKLYLHIQGEADEFVTQLLKVMPQMDKLRTHWQKQLCPKSFDQLKKLDINTYWVTIFPSYIGSSLHSLKKLFIRNCEYLKHVFDVQGVYARETHNEISCLPTRMLCFPNLQQVYVTGCNRLKYLFPSSVAKTLEKLESLKIDNCSMIEAVFDLEGINVQETNVILETRLRILNLESLPNLKHVWNQDGKEIVTFKNLQTVTARKCGQLTSVFPANIAKGLTQLEELIIEDCGVEEIVAMEQGQEMSLSFMFPELTHLTICNVPNLKCFYPRDSIVECPKLKELFLHIEAEAGEFVTQLLKVFPNLETLGLNNIVSVTSIWPQLRMEDFQRLKSLLLHDFNAEHASILYWNLQRIPNLERLRLIDSSFKEVFTHEGHGEGGDNFVHLKWLSLSGLPKLERIYKEGLNLHKYLMHLEQLSVEKCCGLKELVPSSALFNCLGHLEVCKCDGLLHLVTPSTAKSFVQLTTLKIKECSKIKEIVIKEENEDIHHEITFIKLKVLEFHQLSSLESFSSENIKFNFPSLQDFVVNQSPKLTIFSEKIPITPRLRRVQIKDNGNAWYWEGNLNTTIQKMYSDMNADKSIQDSDLSNVDTIP